MPVLEIQTQKKEFKLPAAGTHMARVIRIIDLGIQTTPFKDKEGNVKKPRQLMLFFEIPKQKMDDGRPMIIRTKNLSYSLGYSDYKTKLREYSEAILGQEIQKLDIQELLGKPAMISISHLPYDNDPSKKYASVTGVMQVLEGIDVPEAINPLVNFSTTEFNLEVYNLLDEWIRKKINLPAGINLDQSSNETDPDAEELLA